MPQEDYREIWRARRLGAELRVNLIRIVAIACFYSVHLWHVASPKLGTAAAELIGLDPSQPVAPAVHLAVTLFCLSWVMLALATHFLIYKGVVSDAAILCGALFDVALLTGLLAVSSGPRGPMVAGYFLIVLLAGLRFDLRLVRITTAAAAIGYIVLLGFARWPIGILKNAGVETVPRYHQIMVVLAIVLAGVIVGQIVRQAYLVCEFSGAARSEKRP